ncbi:glycerol-3-phosphate 1-O-acyltransferase PlsY [Phenylobacterium sp.]|uniref:glycerol-3-phosphate 1-O-acyltransferase PlsY n=1 Tax=Phenylobacterium sp. TaxID=1871053 RepID=UPI002D180C52|nr:glycerol-3-phosphate 1-O-acyltransferase PlsY [Phenylobacterium sp.]HVI34078.1 glycerol-3-phosphate 1-O-acyltransferase PlsY [Phenylobacterium sp.]
MVWIVAVAALVAAYLLGSVPTAWLAARWLKGIDIRAHGSGSVGATNAIRTLGVGPGLAVLAVDLAKGWAAVALARALMAWAGAWAWAGAGAGGAPDPWAPWVVAAAGLAVVVGHARSVWLGFTGGKSAATGLGVLLALAWPVGLGAGVVVVGVLAAWRFMSLASMTGALTSVALVWALPQPLPTRLLVTVGALYVVVRHRANIGRLRAGTEPRVGAG